MNEWILDGSTTNRPSLILRTCNLPSLRKVKVGFMTPASNGTHLPGMSSLVILQPFKEPLSLGMATVNVKALASPGSFADDTALSTKPWTCEFCKTDAYQ